MRGLVSASPGLDWPFPMAAELGCERKLQGLVRPGSELLLRFLWTKVSHGLAQPQETKEQPPWLDRRSCRDDGCAAFTMPSGLEPKAGRGVVWLQGLESSCGSKCKGKPLKRERLNLIENFQNQNGLEWRGVDVGAAALS